MISTFDSLKAMNEEVCYESTIKEKAYERVYCEKLTKALSLSDVLEIDLEWVIEMLFN